MVHEENVVVVFEPAVLENFVVFLVLDELNDFFIILFQFPELFLNHAVPNVVEYPKKGIYIIVERILLHLLPQVLEQLGKGSLNIHLHGFEFFFRLLDLDADLVHDNFGHPPRNIEVIVVLDGEGLESFFGLVPIFLQSCDIALHLFSLSA